MVRCDDSFAKAEPPDDRVQDIPPATDRKDRRIARQITYSAADARPCLLFFGFYKKP